MALEGSPCLSTLSRGLQIPPLGDRLEDGFLTRNGANNRSCMVCSTGNVTPSICFTAAPAVASFGSGSPWTRPRWTWLASPNSVQKLKCQILFGKSCNVLRTILLSSYDMKWVLSLVKATQFFHGPLLVLCHALPGVIFGVGSGAGADS